MSTPEGLEVGRRNLLAQLRQSLDRDLTEYPVDAATMRELVQVLEGLAPDPEVCQGCGYPSTYEGSCGNCGWDQANYEAAVAKGMPRLPGDKR